MFQVYLNILFKKGNCKNPSKNKFSNEELNFNKLFNLTTSTSIYSNYQKTLSFIISINFISIINNIDDGSINEIFEGFELKFKSYNNNTSCMQIIPNKQTKSTPYSYSFKIKDPSFLSLKNLDYSFYFGKVSISLLEKCEHNDLCSNENIKTSDKEIGIRSENPLLDSSKPIETSKISIL